MSVKTHILSRAIINRLGKENISFSFDKFNGTIEFEYNNKIFSMQVENFPFQPPKLLKVDNKLIDYAISSSRVFNIIRDVFGLQCLCCISILCPNTWNLMNKFTDIVNEYEKFMNIIKTANNYKILLINNKFDVLPLDVINEINTYLKV
jgi:hypothetical protein